MLPTVSKVFERLMCTQISEYMSQYLSYLLCGFLQGFNAQHALIRTIEKWRTCLDKGGKVGAIFMDLSKCDMRLENVISRLENDSKIII